MTATPDSAARDPEASPERLLALLDKDDATNRLLARHLRASAELLEKLSHSSDKVTRRAVASHPNIPPQTLVRLGQQFPKEFLANPALDLLLMVSPDLIEQAPQAFLIRLLKQAACPTSLLVWAAGHSQAKVQLAVGMNANAPRQALEKLNASAHPSVLDAIRSKNGFGLIADPEKGFKQAVLNLMDSRPTESLYWDWRSGAIGLAQWSALPSRFRLAIATPWRELPAAMVAVILHKTTWEFDRLNKVLRNYPWSHLVDGPDLPVPLTLLELLAKDSDQEVRRNVARHPSASAGTLELLAADSEAWVRADVASNPSAACDVLQALAGDLDEAVRAGVARNPATRVLVLEILARDSHPNVRWGVASNPSTPMQMLDFLAGDTESWVRTAVASNSATPGAVLDELANDSDVAVRETIAGNTSASRQALAALAEDAESKIHRRVARNPSAPAKALERLGQDLNSWIRADVGGNPSSPVEVLEALATDPEGHVREKVACNPSTPASTLQLLSQDMQTSVRLEVAGNPAAPSSALEMLAKDSDDDARQAVASNRSTPEETLELMAKDLHTGVRIEVARNPSTPLSALAAMAKGKAANVRYAVAAGQSHRSEQLSRALWSDAKKGARLSLASNHQLSPALLDEFAKSAEQEVELVVLLGNKNLGESTAQFLADRLLTMEPTESPWYRQELSKASPDVVRAAQLGQVLSYFGKDPDKAALAQPVLPKLMALSSGPFIEPSRIVRLAGSTDWLIRAAVARNRGTPETLLKKLGADVHPLVASLARSSQRYLSDPHPDEATRSAPGPDLFRAASEILDRARKLASAGRGHSRPASIASWVVDEVWGDRVGIDELIAVLSQHQGSSDMFPSILDRLDPAQVAWIFDHGSKSMYTDVRSLLAQCRACPISALKTLSVDAEPQVLLGVLSNPSLPRSEHTSIVRRLERKSWRRQDEKRRAFVNTLMAKALPPDVLEALMLSSYQFWVLRNEFVPARLLEAMASGLIQPEGVAMKVQADAQSVRVAANPSAPSALLARLGKHAAKRVRQAVAGNVSAPMQSLEMLANDSEQDVREEVAGNSSAPQPVLESFSEDSNKSIRVRLAGNPSTPETMLQSLAMDTTGAVREAVAANSSTPAAILEMLSEDAEDAVQSAVAGNRATPSAILGKMATDPDERFLRPLANNPSTPLPQIKAMSMHWERGVRVDATMNIAARFSCDQWAIRFKQAIQRKTGINDGVAHERPGPLSPVDVLRGLEWLELLYGDEDPKGLTKASRSRDWLFRLGVALHPGTNEGILRLLRKDSDVEVARAAALPRAEVVTAGETWTAAQLRIDSPAAYEALLQPGARTTCP
jgi:hypothetical protein